MRAAFSQVFREKNKNNTSALHDPSFIRSTGVLLVGASGGPANAMAGYTSVCVCVCVCVWVGGWVCAWVWVCVCVCVKSFVQD